MNKLLALILMMLMTGAASAQKELTYSFQIGFPVISFFDSPDAPHEDPEQVKDFSKYIRLSGEFSLNADMLLSNNLTLSSGLEYVERGGSYRKKHNQAYYVNSYSLTGIKEDDAYNYFLYRLSYLEIPIRLKFNINELINSESDGKFNIFAGPTAMLNLVSKRRYNEFIIFSKVTEIWEVDKLPEAQAFVIGFNSGLEWRTEQLIFFIKYLRNLTNLYDTSQSGYENFDTSMHSISLGLGIEF